MNAQQMCSLHSVILKGFTEKYTFKRHSEWMEFWWTKFWAKSVLNGDCTRGKCMNRSSKADLAEM